jgi:electron transfer flavoprotein alpha subunit
MSILVICEVTHGEIDKNHLKTIAAAQQFCQPITCLILTDEPLELLKSVSLPAYTWLEKAYISCGKKSPLQCVQSILACDKDQCFSTIIATDNTLTKQFLPHIAALYNVDMVSGVIEILENNTYKRAVFAGEFIATVKNNATTQVISIRASAFKEPQIQDTQQNIQPSIIPVENSSNIIYEFSHTIENIHDLTTAEIVIAGGRGLGDAKHFELILALAKKLGAAVGATRAAVDAGWVDNALQIGQTGKIIAPKLYIAIGISGAIQHLAGIKGSKNIIAINKDPDAPIMRFADYVFEGDLFEVIPKLTNMLTYT